MASWLGSSWLRKGWSGKEQFGAVASVRYINSYFVAHKRLTTNVHFSFIPDLDAIINSIKLDGLTRLDIIRLLRKKGIR